MPDDAAPATVLGIPLFHMSENALDGEVLLVAGNLLDARIEDSELVDQFQQPLWATEAVNRPILRGYLSLALHFEGIKVFFVHRFPQIVFYWFFICAHLRNLRIAQSRKQQLFLFMGYGLLMLSSTAASVSSRSFQTDQNLAGVPTVA